MLTGRRAFEAENSASVIAAILEREPPNLEEVEPAGLRLVLHRCLTKDPDDRWQSAADLKAALEFTAEAAPPQRPRKNFGAGWLAAGLLAVALAATFIVYSRQKPPEQRVVRLQIGPPGNDRFSSRDSPVLSPDGTRIVFSAGGKLFVRSLDSLATQELPGTEGGHLPFWSPDSRSVAFFADVRLSKISLLGGPPVALSTSTLSRGIGMFFAQGGAWNRDGVILFAPSPLTGLIRIGADGGTAVPLTRLDAARGETYHAWPSFLPDGKHFLFTVYSSQPANGGVFIGSLDSPRVTRLLPEQTNAQSRMGGPGSQGRRQGHRRRPQGPGTRLPARDPGRQLSPLLSDRGAVAVPRHAHLVPGRGFTGDERRRGHQVPQAVDDRIQPGITWVPSHIKDGRFGKRLDGARVVNLSQTGSGARPSRSGSPGSKSRRPSELA